MFFCGFCKISKNTFFTEHLWWLLLKRFELVFHHPLSYTIVIRTEHSLETRAEPAGYLVYVENRVILEASTLLGARNVNKY